MSSKIPPANLPFDNNKGNQYHCLLGNATMPSYYQGRGCSCSMLPTGPEYPPLIPGTPTITTNEHSLVRGHHNKEISKKKLKRKFQNNIKSHCQTSSHQVECAKTVLFECWVYILLSYWNNTRVFLTSHWQIIPMHQRLPSLIRKNYTNSRFHWPVDYAKPLGSLIFT